MEDDDEFGDLYTDVLQPLQMSSAPPQQPIQSTPQPPTRSIDLNDRIPSDDEEILYGAKNSGKLKCDQPGPNLILNKTDGAVEKTEKYWGEEAAPPPDSGGRVFGGSSGLVKVEEKGFEQDPNFLDDIKGEFSQSKEETLEENFGIEDAAGEEGDFLIPGLSSSGARVLERGVKEGDGGDDWDDSDSEDDLQIVLNDNTGGGIMGMDGGVGQDEEDDEDGDNLVIVTGNADPTLHHHPPMEDLQDWGEDPSQAAEGMGERKDLLGGDAAGRPEVGGAAAAQKIGYGSHGYHPFHSQFKYVRPGAAPMPGAGPVATGGVPGQIRPPANMVPFAGRGRADWRPPGIKNAAPMQKNFHPGYGAQGWGNNGAGRGFGSGLDFTLPSHKTIFEVDIDGFEEKPWRLQGVDVSDFFNFGMNEENWKAYCKHLEQHRLEATMQSKIRVYESGRPEQEYDPDLPPELAAAAGHDISENRNMGKTDLQNDLAKGSARGRMQLPTGKAIQVETGFGERLPSIDTRPPRVRDSDAIIEIVLQRSPDHESVPGNDEPEDDVPSQRESHEVEDDIVSEDDHFDRPQPQPYNNSRKREASGRPPSMVGTTDKRASSHYSETEMEDHQDSRIKKVNSPHNQITHSPPSSPPTSFDQTDAIKDETLAVDRKSTEREGANDTKTRRTMKKQKHSSVERDDSKAAKSSENSKAISDQNMRDSVEQEVMQGGGGSRRAVDEDDRMVRRQERERHQTDPYSHRKWDPNTHHRPHVKSENFERKKVRESEGVIWQDEDPHVGRMRMEDMRKRNHEEEMASRHRNKARESERIDKIEHRSRKASENGLKTRHNVSDKREEPLHVHRESTSRRKRERDDNLDHHKRDDEQQQLQMQQQLQQQQQQQQQQQSFRYKEDGRLKRERDEWKERDGHRGIGIGHSRVKEDYRSMEKDYQFKEQSRRDRVESESVSRHRGREDVYAAHGNKVSSNNEERISRHERGYSGKDVQDKKQKESVRKGKESDGGIHNSVAGSRRNREDHSSQRASSKSMVEQTRKSSKKHKENPSSEDEQQESRKGRSKLERWTSHKERDFGVALKEPDNGAHTKLPDPEPSKPQETIANPKPDEKEKEKEKEKESNAKTDDSNDNKHLDTVEKLKKRSERFKLPMPSEKEALAVKKMENEPLASAQQPEARPESEVKPERPARKRRWTSG